MSAKESIIKTRCLIKEVDSWTEIACTTFSTPDENEKKENLQLFLVG